MDDEFVEIEFTEKRKVYVDGRHNGYTNKILRIAEGEYTFSIEGEDFSPSQVTKYIEDTTALKPEKIKFSQVAS